MGRDKATLPFGPELMLQRVVRLLGTVIEFERMVVVAAPNQNLPELPKGVTVTYDKHQNRGPLEGLAAGFRSIGNCADAVYATSCDVPLVVPGFVQKMFELLGDNDIVVPHDGQHHHPLAAIYRTSVLQHIECLLAADRLRPRFLFDEVKTHEVSVDELRSVDPQLTTLQNLNHPDDYQSALLNAGIVGFARQVQSDPVEANLLRDTTDGERTPTT